MSTYMAQLSTEESEFFNILNHVGCLTVWQAKKILEKYLFCSNAQATRIIQNLCNHQYITLSTNHNFLTAGVRSSKFHSKVDTKVLRGMHICIDFIDSLEEMKFTHLPSDNTNLVFLSNGNLYKVIDIHLSEQFKINAMRQSFIDAMASQRKNLSSNKALYPYTTIFSVPASENKDDILDMFENAEISFPAAFAYFKTDNLDEAPSYELYKLELEQE